MSSALALPPSSSRILAATESSEDWLRAPRGRLPSLPTELLSVSPAFIAQLRSELAPKRKGARLRFVLALMLLAVVGVLGSDRSTREFVIDKSEVLTARYFQSRRVAAEPVANVAPAATPVASAAPAASPAATTEVVQQPVLVVPAKAPKMVSPSPPKKRPAGRPVSAIGKGVRGAVLVVGSSLKSGSRRS